MKLTTAFLTLALVCSFQFAHASSFRPDSGSVNTYTNKLILHFLEYKITDNIVQDDLLALLNSINTKKTNLFITNEALFKTKAVSKDQCECDGIIVNMKHFNEELIGNLLLEYKKIILDKEFMSLLVEDKDLAELAHLFNTYYNHPEEEISLARIGEAKFLLSSLLFYKEFKAAYSLNRAIIAGLPNKDLKAREAGTIGIEVYERDIAPLEVTFDNQTIDLLILKARSTSNIKDFLKEIRENKFLKEKYIE